MTPTTAKRLTTRARRILAELREINAALRSVVRVLTTNRTACIVPLLALALLTGCNAQSAGRDLEQTGAKVDLQTQVEELRARNAALAQANLELSGQLEANVLKAGGDIAALKLELTRIQETRQTGGTAGRDITQTTVDPVLLQTIERSVYALCGAICFAALCVLGGVCFRARQDRLLNADDCRCNVDLVNAARDNPKPITGA
jgi:predicted small secreted protein